MRQGREDKTFGSRAEEMQRSEYETLRKQFDAVVKDAPEMAYDEVEEDERMGDEGVHRPGKTILVHARCGKKRYDSQRCFR